MLEKAEKHARKEHNMTIIPPNVVSQIKRGGNQRSALVRLRLASVFVKASARRAAASLGTLRTRSTIVVVE